MTDQAIINAVDPLARRAGVPSVLWEAIAEVESGLNPKAVGDNGSSFGLFQLHRGGQLPAQYNNCTAGSCAVFDPVLNAQYAMPAISSAWSSLSRQPGAPSGTSAGSLDWWYSFAGQSGHPGVGDPAQINEARRLQAQYSTLVSAPLPAASGAPLVSLSSPAGGCNIADPLTYGSCALQFQQSAVSSALRVGIFLLACVLVIAGLWVTTK